MTNQASVTVASTIKPGRLNALKEALTKVASEVQRDGGIFGRINADRPAVHFGRWVVLEQKEGANHNILEPQLLYLCDVDFFDGDDNSEHLRALVRHRRSSMGR